MTEEEKKAIDILINEIADIVVGEYCTHCKICENEDTECYYTKTIDTVYNLINKQQKEIEQLKENQIWSEATIEGLKSDFIQKYKIRVKINELEEQQEENRKELYNAINSLNFRKIEMISNRISKNIIERDILNELLEENKNEN